MRTLSKIHFLAILVLTILFSSNVEAQRFSTVTSFGGTYYGKLDGRNAKLEFDALSHNAAYVEWKVILTDLDRRVTMRGTTTAAHVRHGGDHILESVTVRSADERTIKKFAKIYLHTWNTNYITAITDKGYGSVFAANSISNLPAASPSTVNHFRTPTQFYGTYKGRIDGRNAKLEIKRTSDGKCSITLTDLDRSVTYKTIMSRVPFKILRQHQLKQIILQKVGGRGSKTIGGLYMHTWNTNYISGFTVWSGKQYGNFFVRQETSRSSGVSRSGRGRGRR